MMRALVLLSILLAGATSAAAQQAPVPPAPPPDVEIFARVNARELIFEIEPEGAHIQAFGEVNGQPALTVARTDRQNLPEEVQPRVLYRDIGIILTITSILPDIEAILDDALGPQPATSETQPADRPSDPPDESRP